MSTELIVGIVLVVLVGLAIFFKLPSRIRDWWSRARTFLKETRSEVAKVTFPSRQDVIATTVVVIITSAIFAVFLTLSDAVINKVYGLIFSVLGT